MPSPRRSALLAVPALLAAGVVSTAGPALAEVTGGTSTGDVVLLAHCQQHPISYDLRVGPLTLPWRVEFQVADPQGFVSEGTVLNSATNPPTSGTFTVTFCGSEPAGTYTVLGTVRTAPVDLGVPLKPTTFEVRPAATRTSLAAAPAAHGRHRLTMRVREQAEHGFGRADGVTVRVERWVDGAWKKLPGTTLTTVRGTVTTLVGGAPGTQVRAVVPGRNNYSGSASRPVRL